MTTPHYQFCHSILIGSEANVQSSYLQSVERSKDVVAEKSTTIQQLKTKVSQLELERAQLQDNIYEAEQALRLTVKDREHMSVYVKTLSSAFEQV